MIRQFALVTFLFVMAIGVVGQQGPRDAGEPCGKEQAALAEIRLRAMASQTSLELLREYSKALDESYEATRKSAYADSVVDTASLVAGWPMGKGIQEYFLGKAKDKFTEKLVKAGFKSVEKALLKDPSLNGMLENLTSPIQSTSGIQYDLAKEYYKKLSKEMFGDVAGEAVTSALDLMKFGLTAYKGMKRLDGIRKLARSTNDQIIQLQAKHTDHMEYWDSASRALDLCNDRVAKSLPPDPNNRFWTDVVEYLGPNWNPDLKESGKKGSTSSLRIPDLSGVWKAAYANVVRTITQNDNKISWTADYMYGPTKIVETAEGTVSRSSGGSVSVEVTITYTTATEPTRKGTYTASISVDSNGKATKFSWNNGDVYVRVAGK